MCDRNKLFAVLKYKVYCLLETCYLKYKYFYEDYQMKLLNIKDFQIFKYLASQLKYQILSLRHYLKI